MKTFISILASTLFFLSSLSQTSTDIDLKEIFEGYELAGCMVIYDQNKNEFFRYNNNLCDTGYIPGSTFAIPNALIALEEGVILDDKQEIIWNNHTWRIKAWNKNQTLKSAVESSCIWVFAEFANQIGIDKYKTYTEEFGYGNKLIGEPENRFWLSGDLRISANQQIDFLRKFYNYDLSLQQRSVDIVKNSIVKEKNEKFTLSTTFGFGQVDSQTNILWQVGCIKIDNNVYFFALNAKAPKHYSADEAKRYLLKDILKELKILN